MEGSSQETLSETEAKAKVMDYLATKILSEYFDEVFAAAFDVLKIVYKK